MHASHARHLRHREFAARRARRGSSTVRAVALAIPIVMFGSLLAVGRRGRSRSPATPTTRRISRIPDRRSKRSCSPGRRRSGTGRARSCSRPRHGPPRTGHLRRHPGRAGRRHHRPSRTRLLGEHRHRPAGFASAAIDTLTGDARGGSTITQQLVRQKLLPEESCRSRPLGAQDQGAHPVGPRHRRLPRPRGQGGHPEAYLNQNFYGNHSYGVRPRPSPTGPGTSTT